MKAAVEAAKKLMPLVDAKNEPEAQSPSDTVLTAALAVFNTAIQALNPSVVPMTLNDLSDPRKIDIIKMYSLSRA